MDAVTTDSSSPSAGSGREGFRSRIAAQPHVKDRVDAATVFVIGVLLILIGITSIWSWFDAIALDGAGRWWHVVPLAIGCGALLLKRHHPILALAIGVSQFLLDLGLGGSLSMMLVIFDLLFAVGLYASGPARRGVTVVAGGLVIVLSVLAGWQAYGFRGVILSFLQFSAMFLIPFWWARNVRQKSELAELAQASAELERERARDLERLGELSRHEAVQEARSAMARDLHDVIASHMSSVAIHSGAALARPPDATLDRDALVTIRQDSLASLEEMRSMIMLLRSPDHAAATDEPWAAPARLSRLDDLVAAFHDQGVIVKVSMDPVDQLPAAVDQAAHRIIQEALTNVAKHAPRGTVQVEIRRESRSLDVTVENVITAPPSHPAALSAGTGLTTMRERAEALDGTFRAGRTGDDHWQVHAILPLGAGDRAFSGSGQ